MKKKKSNGSIICKNLKFTEYIASKILVKNLARFGFESQKLIVPYKIRVYSDRVYTKIFSKNISIFNSRSIYLFGKQSV